ncbi:hypothetical protein BDE36_2514 [Arcticibacter tournemirensis]|nr:hypothetical protein BDE36_2514 [Arcticibacter tournemirensis]
MKRLNILLLLPVLISCNSPKRKNLELSIDSIKKENEFLKREKEIIRKEKELLIREKEKSQKTTYEDIKLPEEFWLGKWSYYYDQGEYTLTIEGQIRGMNRCTILAEGVQLYYEADLVGVQKGNSFIIYYRGLTNGSNWYENKVDINEPLLTLKYQKGKVSTVFHQVDTNLNGKVNFEKKS